MKAEKKRCIEDEYHLPYIDLIRNFALTNTLRRSFLKLEKGQKGLKLLKLV